MHAVECSLLFIFLVPTEQRVRVQQVGQQAKATAKAAPATGTLHVYAAMHASALLQGLRGGSHSAHSEVHMCMHMCVYEQNRNLASSPSPWRA